MNFKKITLENIDIKQGKLSHKDRVALINDIFQGFLNSKTKKNELKILKIFRQDFARMKSLFNQISKHFCIEILVDEDQINFIYEKQRQEFQNLAQELKLFNRNI